MADDDNPTFEDLRGRYKAASKQIADMEKELADLRSYRQQETFRQAGFDPDSKQGKALMKLHDGDITVEAIRETADAFGLTADSGDTGSSSPLPDATQQRMGQQAAMNDVRAGTQPASHVDRMSFDAFRQLSKDSPREAAQVLQDRRVDLPGPIARTLEDNRNFNPLGR